MTVSRRNVMTALGALSAAAASGSVSACSYADHSNLELPGAFFMKMSQGLILDARKMLAKSVSLSIASSVGGQLFEGKDDVTAALDKLLNREGFEMIGDTDDVVAGGMYWRKFGIWLCSDMLKGNAVELSVCGDGLASSVFNVFVDADLGEGRHIRSILLVESRYLMVQMQFGALPISIEK